MKKQEAICFSFYSIHEQCKVVLCKKFIYSVDFMRKAKKLLTFDDKKSIFYITLTYIMPKYGWQVSTQHRKCWTISKEIKNKLSALKLGGLFSLLWYETKQS